jgi:hypothetical protein
MIDADVQNALKYARAGKYTLRPPKLAFEVGVYFSDGIVPASLHHEVRFFQVGILVMATYILFAQLVKELDSLAEIEPKDFHPGTRGKVSALFVGVDLGHDNHRFKI